MIDFSKITNIEIPEGNAISVALSDGTVLWKKSTEPISDADTVITDVNGNTHVFNIQGTLDNHSYMDIVPLENVANVKIGTGVTSLDVSVFQGCDAMTSVTIPDSVTSIGNNAFQSCRSLTSVTIPDSVTSIGNSAFYNCIGLTSIDIPDSVTSIGSYAFVYCSSLTSVTIPSSVTSIGNAAFMFCGSLTSITIPNSVTSIDSMAFYQCSGLTSVTIPDSVTSIGESAFGHCLSLATVTIPDSVTSIGNSAFYGCSSLVTVTIPNGVTTIGNNAFANCTSLTSVTIPNSVTSIGSRAFYGCSKLTTMTVQATTPPTLANTNAISTATTTIYVPAESVDAYKADSVWGAFSSIIQPIPTEYQLTDENFRFYKGKNPNTATATTPTDSAYLSIARGDGIGLSACTTTAITTTVNNQFVYHTGTTYLDLYTNNPTLARTFTTYKITGATSVILKDCTSSTSDSIDVKRDGATLATITSESKDITLTPDDDGIIYFDLIPSVNAMIYAKCKLYYTKD